MKVSYHTTCIYSFCGHSTIPRDPTQNARPCSCPHRSTGGAQEPDHSFTKPQIIACDPDSSTLPFDLSFPSPQEFEFARVLHHSVPASPVSAISVQSKTQISLSPRLPSQISSETSTKNTSQSHFLSTLSTSNSSPPYHHLKSHPFRTFIIPTLCPPCRTSRDSNMARFEARAIRDLVEREGNVNFEGADIQSSSRDGEGSIRSGKKKMVGRKLMPLILVEEGRLKREIAVTGTGSEGQHGKRVSSSDERVPGEEQSSSVEIAAGIGGQVEIITPASSSSSIRSATAASSSSKWSWWNRKVSHALPNSVTAVSRLDSNSDIRSNNSERVSEMGLSGTKDSTSLVSVVGKTTVNPLLHQAGWPETSMDLEDEIARDAVGRNVKGMQRILEWDDNTGHRVA